VGFRRLYYLLGNAIGVHWRLTRKIFIWLGIFVGIGIIFGFVTIFTAKFSVTSVSNGMLDVNLLRVIRSTGFVSIILGRVLDFALLFLGIFLVCMHRWTVFLVFPYVAYRGFSIVVNLYWIFAKFGMFTGLALFLSYLFWFIVLLFIVFAVIIYCMRMCAGVRRGGFRGAIRWNDFARHCGVFLGVICVFAFLEWLVYWLVLSKIVFIV